MTSCPALDADQLTLDFGDGALLDRACLSLRAGEVTALVGGNGVGKSSLLDCLSGDVLTYSGTIRMNGVSVDSQPSWRRARRGLRRLFQDLGSFGSLTARETLTLATQAQSDALNGLMRISRSPAADDQVEHLLTQFGLETAADIPSAALSRGAQRLLAMARLLAGTPRVVLLDEPSAGLTSEAKDRIAAILRELQGRGAAILLVEHDHDFVKSLAQQILRLRSGRLEVDS